MTFDGNDYTVIGLSLEFVGGYLLARGFLRSVSFETTRMHLGSNPFQIRNLIRSHYEARVGFSCFLLGLIGALVGTVRSAQVGQMGLVKDSLYLFLVSVVVGAAVLVWACRCWQTARQAGGTYRSSVNINARRSMP